MPSISRQLHQCQTFSDQIFLLLWWPPKTKKNLGKFMHIVLGLYARITTICLWISRLCKALFAESHAKPWSTLLSFREDSALINMTGLETNVCRLADDEVYTYDLNWTPLPVHVQVVSGLWDYAATGIRRCVVTNATLSLTTAIGNGNGLLFHMTQPISRSTKAIACSKPTISEH